MEMYLSICFLIMKCAGEDESKCHSEDGDVVVDLGSVALGDALADPDDVAALLLLQLEEGVEDAKVELLHEGILVQPHLK